MYGSTTQWLCCFNFQLKKTTAQTAMWGRNIQRRTTDSADNPMVRWVGRRSFLAESISGLVPIWSIRPPTRSTIWETCSKMLKKIVPKSRCRHMCKDAELIIYSPHLLVPELWCWSPPATAADLKACSLLVCSFCVPYTVSLWAGCSHPRSGCRKSCVWPQNRNTRL